MATEENKVVEETTNNGNVDNAPQKENVKVDTEKKEVETSQEETKTEEKKALDLNSLLKDDKEFASQFDAKVSKSINTAKEKWEKEYEEKLNKEKQEIEKGFENEKQKYQTKISILSKNVKADNVDDVMALAERYKSEDNNIDEAIEKVLEKYPHFKGDTNKVLKAGKEVDGTKEPTDDKVLAYLKKHYPGKYNK